MDTKLFDDLTKGVFEKRLFAYMKAVGLSRITLNYSGGGDSGGLEHMDFHPAVKDKVSNGIRDSLEEELCSPIYNRHGSFADGGGYYVNGEVNYNADSNTVYISGTDHNTEYSNYDEETGDCDEETHDEDWEECIYSNNHTDNSQEVDYLFTYLYARDFLEGKLPEDLHNKLIVEASLGEDEHAVNYVREIK